MLTDLITIAGIENKNLTVEICDRSGNSAMNININGRQVSWEKVHKWISCDLKLTDYATEFGNAMKYIDGKSHDYRCQV